MTSYFMKLHLIANIFLLTITVFAGSVLFAIILNSFQKGFWSFIDKSIHD